MFTKAGAILVASSAMGCILPGVAHARTAIRSEPQSGTASALTQSTTRTEARLSDIIVTARRRSEALQAVPIAITAFDQETINQARITSGADLQRLIPSLTVTNESGKASATVTLRGQGSVYSGTVASPGVVSYFAEVPTPGGFVTPGTFYDLQNIQVLKGPQGTLFGKNTTGGALLFEPKRPSTSDIDGFVQGAYGNYDAREVQGALNIPVISDKIAVRVAGLYGKRNGYTKDIYTGRRYDNDDYHSYRVGVLITPTEGLSSYFLFNAVDSRNNGLGFKFNSINPASPLRFLFPTTNFNSIVALQKSIGPRRTFHDDPSRGQNKSWSIQNNTMIGITDGLTLKNIASYSKLRQHWNEEDNDGTNLPILQARNFDNTSTLNQAYLPVDRGKGYLTSYGIYTEEAQLQAKLFDDMLSTTLGAYYENDNPEGWSIIDVTNFVAPGQTLNTQAKKTKLANHAVFGQASYRLDRLGLQGVSVTAGYRQSWDRINQNIGKFNGSRYGPLAGTCQYPTDPLVGTDCFAHLRKKTTDHSYSLGVDWVVAPDKLLYFTTRRGFKVGGFTASAPPSFEDTGPEHVLDYELGFKGDWNLPTGARLRTNIALFHDVYKGRQTIQVVAVDRNPAIIAALTSNDFNARISGVELETTLIATKWLEFSGFYGFLSTKYTKYNDFCANVGLPGGAHNLARCMVTGLNVPDRLPFTPRNKASLTSTFTLWSGQRRGDFSVSGTVNYTSRQSQGGANGIDKVPLAALIPQYTTLDASVNWNNINGSGIGGSLYVTNLTNKTYISEAYNVYNPALLGFSSITYGPPRMYGVRASYKF